MNGKLTSAVLALWVLSALTQPVAAQVLARDEGRQAIQVAVDKAREALTRANLPRNTPISILPIRGDLGGYIEGLLKNAITAAGLEYVEGKSDPFWVELLREIEWDQRKDDILDPETLNRFKRLRATRLLMYAFIRAADFDGSRVYTEIELHVSEIETARHLWGGTFWSRIYLPGPREGLVRMPPELNDALRKALKARAQDLTAAGKLAKVQRVVSIPLSGDIGQHITAMVRAMFNETPLRILDADVRTLAQARLIARGPHDPPVDGVLVGSIRDLSVEVQRLDPIRKKYIYRAELDLEIHNAEGEILWADATVAHAEKTPGWWDQIFDWIYEHPRATYGILGVLGGLVFLGALWRMARRTPR